MLVKSCTTKLALVYLSTNYRANADIESIADFIDGYPSDYGGLSDTQLDAETILGAGPVDPSPPVSKSINNLELDLISALQNSGGKISPKAVAEGVYQTSLSQSVEFGVDDNVYSKEDRVQVTKNIRKQKELKKSERNLLRKLKRNATADLPIILKSAFAPGPTKYYDYKKELWYNFEYKGINMVAGGLVYSRDRIPPHCNVYNPEVQWEKRDFKYICQKLRRALPDVKTSCQMLDLDRNGGTCGNYRATMSFENFGKPDVWVNQNTFSWKASNDPEQDCHLYTYHEYSTVVYACENDIVFHKGIRRYDLANDDLEEGLNLGLLSKFAEDAKNLGGFIGVGGDEEHSARSRSSKITTKVHSLSAHNSADLMRMVFTHSGRQGVVDKLFNHGCWCPFIRDADAGFSGRPVDDFDTVCRGHRECLKCGRYDPAPCSKFAKGYHPGNYTVTYSEADASWSCDAATNSPCAQSQCECDLDTALDLNGLIDALGVTKAENKLDVVGDNSKCHKTQPSLIHTIDISNTAAYPSTVAILPTTAYSEFDTLSLAVAPAPAKSGTDVYLTQGRGGRDRAIVGVTADGAVQRIPQVHRCCGTAPTWKVYNPSTHTCTPDGYVLFGGVGDDARLSAFQ